MRRLACFQWRWTKLRHQRKLRASLIKRQLDAMIMMICREESYWLLSMDANNQEHAKIHIWEFVGWSAHLDPFESFHTKMNFLPRMDKVRFGGGASEQKITFCLKWSKRVQIGPKGSQIVKNTSVDYFGPFWTLLDPFRPLWSVDNLAMFGHFWSKMDHFWAIPSHERSTPE